MDTRRELPYHAHVIENYLLAITALYGPLLALIFYTKTLEARRAWIRNFKQLYHFITNSKTKEDEDEERCGSIISIQDSEVVTSSLWEGSNQLMQPFNQEVNPISNVVRISEQL
jgi:hypothetical protein